MGLFFNGVGISNVYYNDVPMSTVFYNGTIVYNGIQQLNKPEFGNFDTGVFDPMAEACRPILVKYTDTAGSNYFQIRVYNNNNVSVRLYWTDNITHTSNVYQGTVPSNSSVVVRMTDIFVQVSNLQLEVRFEASNYVSSSTLFYYEGSGEVATTTV